MRNGVRAATTSHTCKLLAIDAIMFLCPNPSLASCPQEEEGGWWSFTHPDSGDLEGPYSVPELRTLFKE